jgi:hypothetical protein
MEEKTRILLFFKSNPAFCKDLLNLHYYKTKSYFEMSEMAYFGKRRISRELTGVFNSIEHAKSARLVDGRYVFEKDKDEFFGLPLLVPFPPLFNLMIKYGHGSISINHMFDLFYTSNNPQLIILSEIFKNEPMSITKELFEFLNREECNSSKHWTIADLEQDGLNPVLLALNDNVWEKVFLKYVDSELISKI